MSYSITEGVEASKKRVVAEMAIAAKYPDAYLEKLPGGYQEWCSRQVLPDTTGLELLTKVGTAPMVALFTVVEGLRVYHPSYINLALLLNILAKDNVDVHTQLVEAVKGMPCFSI